MEAIFEAHYWNKFQCIYNLKAARLWNAVLARLTKFGVLDLPGTFEVTAQQLPFFAITNYDVIEIKGRCHFGFTGNKKSSLSTM